MNHYKKASSKEDVAILQGITITTNKSVVDKFIWAD